MQQADDTPTMPPGRRIALMGAVAALVTAEAAPAAAAAHDPDAALHAAVAAFRAADDDTSLDNLSDDDADDALCRRWMDLVREITEAEPATMAGLIAKAQATAAALRRYLAETYPDPEAAMAESVAHDVLRVLGAKPWPEHWAVQTERNRRAVWRAEDAAKEGGVA